MKELFERIPHWASFLGQVRDGQSVISHAPRHSLQHEMRQHMALTHRELGFDVVVSIRPDDSMLGGRIDWDQIAGAFYRALGMEPQSCPDALAFRLQIGAAISLAGQRTLATIALGNSGSVEGRFELVTALDYCLEDLGPGPLVLAVMDDFSLYYYEWWRTNNVSRWHLRRAYFRPLDADAIEALVRLHVPDMAGDAIHNSVLEIEKLTGGHFELALEICRDLERRGGEIGGSYWKKTVPTTLASSQALELIRRSLQEQPAAFAAAALEYEQPKPIRDDSALVQKLRVLGVLQVYTVRGARLCPGVIRETIKDILKDSEQDGRRRRIQSASEPWHVPSSLEISDTDIVVLHISDVHAGPPYAFRLSDTDRHDRRSAAEMIGDDLRAEGIEHVDAVVVSGDFTERAEPDEFDSTHRVLTEVLAASGVSWDQTVVVAGNHDVHWPPPGAAGTSPAPVSRNGYALFRQRIGKTGDPLADVQLVTSRSGTTAIRIVSLDTNVVEGPAAGGIGFISMEALQAVSGLLKGIEPPPTVERTATWVVVHHHVFPVTSAPAADAAKRKVSVMGNSSALLSYALDWEAEMILHGHEHQPSITIAQRWPVDRTGGLAPVCVAGAGSFSCKRDLLGPFGRNHYFIHVRRRADILVRSRMLGDEGFSWVAHNDLSIPIGRSASASKSNSRSPGLVDNTLKWLGRGRAPGRRG